MSSRSTLPGVQRNFITLNFLSSFRWRLVPWALWVLSSQQGELIAALLPVLFSSFPSFQINSNDGTIVILMSDHRRLRQHKHHHHRLCWQHLHNQLEASVGVICLVPASWEQPTLTSPSWSPLPWSSPSAWSSPSSSSSWSSLSAIWGFAEQLRPGEGRSRVTGKLWWMELAATLHSTMIYIKHRAVSFSSSLSSQFVTDCDWAPLIALIATLLQLIAPPTFPSFLIAMIARQASSLTSEPPL